MPHMYSENIIFFDTEFTDLNARTGELLSLGMISFDGERELYLEFDYDGPVHPWVEKNVFPTLTEEKKYSKKDAEKKIREFVGDSKPYLMAYVNQFDSVFWYDLMGSPKDQNPVYWIPIDFASVLFATGFDPNSMAHHAFFDELGIDKSTYKLHNALEDARMLRDVYMAFIQNISNK